MLALEEPSEEALDRLYRRAREALTAEQRRALADAFRGFLADDVTRHEPPPPAWCGTMGEARMWAEAAHELYRKAVALAAFEAMRPENKTAFIEHVTTRRAAA